MMSDTNNFISLREAASLSGYSSDYVGQLIRSGKLPGKQVFSNVSWVTTEKALREYLDKSRKPESNPNDTLWERVYTKLTSSEFLDAAYTAVCWIAVGFFALFMVFVISVLAISIDHSIERGYIERMQHVQ